MRRSLLVSLALILLGLEVTAQAIQSNGTGGGNWSDPATWVGGVVPTFANGVITVRTGDVVTVNSNFVIDQAIVQAGATLLINTSGTLTINNGAGVDFTMNGQMTVEGVFILDNGSTHAGMTAANTSFASGAIYRHRFTTAQGVIPLAAWDADSEVIIEGYTSFATGNASGNWGQNFGNFRWNCTNQSAAVVNLAGNLVSVNNFNVVSTNGQILRLSVNQNPTINIAGDLTISGTSQFDFATTGVNTTANIGGNFNINTTAGSTRLNTSGNCVVNITGDFSMNAPGGTFSLSSGSGIGTLNLEGDFELASGTIVETSSGSGAINFIGSGTTHNFANSGSITNSIAYTIASDNTVIANGESPIQGTAGSSLTVDGTLIMESENSTGAIIIGTGVGGGNVRVATRVFNDGSTLIYAGTGPQIMGAGQPTAAGLTTIIDNGSGVSMGTTALTIGGNLTLETGDLTVEGNNLTVGGLVTLTGGNLNLTTTSAARNFTSNGSIEFNGGNIVVSSGTANATLIINGDLTGVGEVSFTGANSNLTFGGADDLSIEFPLTGPATLENITVTRANNGSIVFPQPLTVTNLLLINEGTVVMNGDYTGDNDITMNGGNLVMNATLTLLDDLNMAAGSTLYFEGQTIELRSQFNNTLTGGVFSADASSTLNILNTGTFGTLEFSPSGNTLGTFFINRPTGGSLVTLNSPLTVESSFTLQDGDFLNTSGLSFGPGAVVTRNSTAAFSSGSAVPGGGPYDLFYTGAGMTAGVESNGNIENFTKNSTGTLTLSGAVNVGNDLTNTTGTINCGANSVTTLNLINLGTFTAPNASALLTLSGNLVNNGTFNRNGGTVEFAGNSSILGTTNPAFNNITISGILTPPTTLTVHGAFTNNGTFNNSGAGTVAFQGTAGTPQVVSGTTVTNFHNISIANTASDPDVIMESNQNLTGVLTLAGTVNFDPDGTSNTAVFTLISSADDPTQDAAIATLPASANISGSVTVQRYMSIEGSNNGRIYRYISSPVQSAPVSQLQAYIPVTGGFSGSSACSGCGTNQSMFQYNENVITDTNGSGSNDADDGYVNFPAAANSETLTTGRGYAVFVRGNVAPVSTAGSALWAVRGSVNRGTVNYNSFVSFTSSGNVANDGWNLVGNPYPSTIDWDAATGWTKTNVTNAIYMRDNGQVGQVYATYVGGVGTNGGSRYIPSGQAYFIKSNGGAINFQSNENVKVAGTQTTFFREEGVRDILRVTLKQNNLRDETVIRFIQGATEGYDEDLDAFKLPNGTFNLASVSGGSKFAINAISFGSSCTASTQLNIGNAPAGNYQLVFSDLASFSSTPTVKLLDNFTGSVVEVTDNLVYNFSITANAQSTGNRFVIITEQPGINQTLAVTGAGSICLEAPYQFTISNAEAGVSYIAKVNGVDVSLPAVGAGTDLTLTIPTENLITGVNTITVFAQRSSCAAIPLQQVVTVSADRIYAVQSVSPATACQPGTVSLSAAGAPADGTYRWYASADSETIVFESASSTFVTPVLDKSRSYFVAINNKFGCEGARMEVRATVENYENVLISETSYGVLQSSYTANNTWYFNDELIQGATGQVLNVSQSGVYKVEVTVGSCKTTDSFEFVVTGVEDLRLQSSIYPNPVVDQLTIDLTGLEATSVELLSNTGASVGQYPVTKNQGTLTINFADKPSGLYLVRVTGNRNAVSTFKIIKR
ncbi:MAG: T9SS type A sorting domain-containing protein [Cyclobacteriaceae bacterium]|nr:T9SS type A sorting domain-containing protein [Cyclobacteriaceae bacterium]